MATKKIKSKLSLEDKDKLKKAVRSNVRKSSAWKGAGMAAAPKKSLKGSDALSKESLLLSLLLKRASLVIL